MDQTQRKTQSSMKRQQELRQKHEGMLCDIRPLQIRITVLEMIYSFAGHADVDLKLPCVTHGIDVSKHSYVRHMGLI